MSTLKVKYNDEWQNVGTTSAALTALAENVGILNSKVDAIKISNPNLLDNPFFSVNQRGVTSGTAITGEGSNVYGYDRWKARNSAHTYMVLSGGARGYLRQHIGLDYEDFKGKTFTLSALREDGNVISVTGVANTTVKPTTSESYFTKTGDDYYLEVWCDASASRCFLTVNVESLTKTVRAVKLELGSQSTLAYDSAPDYATELLKCQRYYQVIYNALVKTRVTITSGVKDNAGFVFLPVEFATTMRGTGNVSLLVNTLGGATVSTGDIAFTLQDMSYWSANATPQGLRYFTFSANSNISMANGTICQTASNVPLIAISADL